MRHLLDYKTSANHEALSVIEEGKQIWFYLDYDKLKSYFGFIEMDRTRKFINETIKYIRRKKAMAIKVKKDYFLFQFDDEENFAKDIEYFINSFIPVELQKEYNGVFDKILSENTIDR